jgi:hypothetical protein
MRRTAGRLAALGGATLLTAMWTMPGGDFKVADPVGEFDRFTDGGWGLGANARFFADPMGIFAIRLDGGFVEYGRERQRACVSLTVGCRLLIDVVTTNRIFFGDIGPEIGIDLGFTRPYVGIARGINYFETASRLEDYDDYDDHDDFDTTNFDDLVWGWKARAGLQLRVSRGSTPVYLDVSAVFHDNGPAEYLTEGDIRDNPDGSITVFPIYSEANLVTFQIGIAVGFGGQRTHPDRDGDRRRPRRR